MSTTGEADSSRDQQRAQLVKLRVQLRPKFRLITLACLFTVMAGAVVAVLLFPDPLGPHSVPGSTAPLGSGTTSVELYEMAEHVLPSAADEQPGSVIFLELQRWRFYPPAKAGETGQVWAERERSWRAADGSGRVVVQRHPIADMATLRPGRLTKVDFSADREWVDEHKPGSMPSWFHAVGEPSTNHARLMRQLTAMQCGLDRLSPSPCPPTASGGGDAAMLMFDAVMNVHRTEILSIAVRRALLTALGGLEGLQSAGLVVDPLGRLGLAVDYHSPGAQRRLVFDQLTGELLASETLQGKEEYGMSDVTLYVSRARLNQVGQ